MNWTAPEARETQPEQTGIGPRFPEMANTLTDGLRLTG